MIKVSIIVPCYNTSKYLQKCIDSLIHQTLKDIEIILINDGSTDDTDKIIQTYHDKRIKYIDKENEGIGKTRNLGIELAKGEYLSFIDSDDYVAPDFCEKMYNKAKRDNCDLVICDYFEDNDGLKKIQLDNFEDSSLKDNPEIINKINLGPCNKIYKRDLFNNQKNRFEENLKYEDAPFVCRLLLSAQKISKINGCLTYYVIHNNSETTRRDKKIFDILKVTDIIVQILKEKDYMNKVTLDLVVMILTDYTIQQRYIKNRLIRNKFINEAFAYLNHLDHNWRKCSYLKKFTYFKRLIKTHKTLTKVYCSIYNKMHN